MKKLVAIKDYVLVLLVATTPVFADEAGFYIGGSLGYSNLDQSESGFNADLATVGITATSNIDDNDLGWKLFAGYNINQYFGAELAYIDLGEADIDVNFTAPVVATASGNAEVDGFAIVGIARYPVYDQLDVFGKIGAFVWDIDAEVMLAGTTSSPSEDGTSVLLGAGVEYEFTKNIGVRAEWEYFNDVEDSDLHLLSIGFEYDF